MPTFRVFDELWERYDKWYAENRVTALNELRALEAIGLRGVGVEVGVGTGFFASRLGVEFGVDPSISMLRVARARGVEVVQGVGEALPLRTASLDYVLLVVTLCFVDDPDAVVAEAARVLRARGVLAACIVPRESRWGQYYIEKRALSPFYSVANFLSVDEVVGLVEASGLRFRGCISTLNTYGPLDEPRHEEPLEKCSGGFVCVIAEKEGSATLGLHTRPRP